MLFVVLAMVLAFAASSGSVTAQGKITLRRLVQTKTTLTGQPLTFPHLRNQVTALLTELAPGGQTGETTLLFPSVAYVMSGDLIVEIQGQAPRTFATGRAFVPPFEIPINSVNRGSKPVRLLTVYFGEQGKPAWMRVQNSAPVGLRARTLLQTLQTWTGEPILFPLQANQFTSVIADFAPGAVNPRHVHPPTEFVYVLEGTSEVDPTGHTPRTFKTGEAFVETPLPHVATNRGTVSGKIFVVFAGEAGVPLTVPMP